MTPRRKFLALIALAASSAFPALAVQARKWRVGILSIRHRPASLEKDFQYGPFLEGMRELGYVEGRDVSFEWRFAGARYDALPQLAAELVRLEVDVIAAVSVPVIRAAQQATSSIPIVMFTDPDPVGNGFVSSLARPGGNITGLSNISLDLSQKQLELLKIIIPKLSSVAVLLNPANSSHGASLKTIQASGDQLGISVVPLQATTPLQVEASFASAARQKVSGMIIAPDTGFLELRQMIIDLAVAHRIPSISHSRIFVDAGGLMSYGQDLQLSFRRAAVYVDKILRGAKPTQLPVELAKDLQLVINRKAASALGLEIPRELLMRADDVVDT